MSETIKALKRYMEENWDGNISASDYYDIRLRLIENEELYGKEEIEFLQTLPFRLKTKIRSGFDDREEVEKRRKFYKPMIDFVERILKS